MKQAVFVHWVARIYGPNGLPGRHVIYPERMVTGAQTNLESYGGDARK